MYHNGTAAEKLCDEEEAACLTKCHGALGLMVESHNHGLNYKHHTPVVKSNIPVCQKNCGIDYGKCLILQGDIQVCIKQEAACALDCLKGVQIVAKLEKPVVLHV